MIGKELELQEQEESVVDNVGWDVGLFDELECFVSNEHRLHLLGESWHDRVAIAIHRESFLDGKLSRLALGEEEVGLGSSGLQRS